MQVFGLSLDRTQKICYFLIKNLILIVQLILIRNKLLKLYLTIRQLTQQPPHLLAILNQVDILLYDILQWLGNDSRTSFVN